MSDVRTETREAQEPRGSEPREGASLVDQAQAWREDEDLPRYVRKCGTSTLVFAERGGGKYGCSPCFCKSWKCPDCAPYRNRADARRVHQALVEHGADGFLFIVATLARRESAERESRPAVRGHRNKREAFDALHELWDGTRRELKKRYAAKCPTTALRANRNRPRHGLAYCATVEQHRDGFPHLNILMRAPELAERVRSGDGQAVHDELLQVFVGNGFGYHLHVDAVDVERGDLASYLVKQAPHSGNMDRELLKATQLPVDGGRHFRRLRSSHAFLPPQPESDWLGVRVNAPCDRVALELERFGPEAFFSLSELGHADEPDPLSPVPAGPWHFADFQRTGERNGVELRPAFFWQAQRIGTVAPDELLRGLAAPGAFVGLVSDAREARAASAPARALGARAEGVGAAQRPLNPRRNKSERASRSDLLSSVNSCGPPCLAPCG